MSAKTVYYPILENLGLLSADMSILSAASGLGVLEFHLAEDYHAKLGLVAPTSAMLNIFESKMLEARIADQILESHVGSFPNLTLSHRYDLILFIHAWNAFGKNEMALRRAMDLRNPDGKIFFAMSSRESRLVSIIKKIEPKYSPHFHFEDLTQWLDELGLSYRKEIYGGDVSFSRYFEGNQPTERCRNWISAMARIPAAEVPNRLFLEVYRAMAAVKQNGAIPNPWGAVIL